MSIDFSTVTEIPGEKITREAASMIVTRYDLAARLGEERTVLELACGSGQGLGLIAGRARRVVGGDYTDGLLRIARRYYGSRVALLRLDAQCLPFAPASFDVVILNEAIYYLLSPQSFVDESRRVLTDDGTLVLSTVNREWVDFNPSPSSQSYPSAGELRTMLERRFRVVRLYGAFPAASRSWVGGLVSSIKRAAVRMRLIPRTMKGKRLLKRLFYGALVDVPAEITPALAATQPSVLLAPGQSAAGFKVLLATASEVECKT